jgi:hypothetical protein
MIGKSTLKAKQLPQSAGRKRGVMFSSPVVYDHRNALPVSLIPTSIHRDMALSESHRQASQLVFEFIAQRTVGFGVKDQHRAKPAPEGKPTFM